MTPAVPICYTCSCTCRESWSFPQFALQVSWCWPCSMALSAWNQIATCWLRTRSDPAQDQCAQLWRPMPLSEPFRALHSKLGPILAPSPKNFLSRFCFRFSQLAAAMVPVMCNVHPRTRTKLKCSSGWKKWYQSQPEWHSNHCHTHLETNIHFRHLPPRWHHLPQSESVAYVTQRFWDCGRFWNCGKKHECCKRYEMIRTYKNW